MPDDAREQKALIDGIVASKPFVGAPGQCALLMFLFENRNTPLMAKEIEEKHYRFPVKSHKHNPGHARERIDDLKKRLEAYASQAPGERWACRLPDAKRGEGYQLEVKKVQRKRTPSELFWSPHADRTEDVVMVCGHHLFFYDPSLNSALRYYDFNMSAGREETLAALKEKHPEGYKPGLEPLQSAYLSTGEVQAQARLQKWFFGRSGALIENFVSRDMPDREIYRKSPILLGRPGTNKFIQRIMDSPKAAHLGYRIHSSLGAVKITQATDDEKRSLSRFPMKAGIVGPVPKWESIFGIFTRLRNPSGYGYVTIISADYYARVITQIVEALTSDRLASDLLAQMNWPAESDLPESFEMLFSIALSPAELEGEGHPELLCWRPHPTAG